MKKCFVICPIGSENSETRKRSDKLLKHIINPVCNECSYETIRVDNLNTSDSITTTIITYLIEADLVIADLTEHNPNVFYEIGYRSALNKPIIHLKDQNDSIPFDVSTIRTFDYDLTDLDSVVQLKERLTKTINSLKLNNSESINKETSDNFSSQILQELFKIQDSIKDLHSKISFSDTSTTSILADKLIHEAQKQKSSQEAAILEKIIPQLIDNPDKFNSLIEMSKKVQQLK